eukprot:994171_1
MKQSREAIIKEFNRNKNESLFIQRQGMGFPLKTDHGKCNAKAIQKKKNRKKKKKKKKNANSYGPLFVSELVPNTIHYKKQLIGRIIVDPFKINAIHMVIEDDFGSVVKASIYNVTRTNKYTNATALCVYEPYYKLGADGTHYIRIDDVSKVKILPKHAAIGKDEKSVGDWKDLGNRCFQTQSYKCAHQCYHRAIDQYLAMDHDNIMISALNNRSLCYMKQGKYKLSLIDIIASKYLNPNVFKVCYRHIKCLAELKHHSQAFMLYKEAIQSFPNHKKELQQLKDKLALDANVYSKSKRSPTQISSEWDVLGVVIDHILNAPHDCDKMEDKTALELKQMGNKHFVDGDYAAAIEYYTTCLVSHSQMLSILLSNRAASKIHLKEYKTAFQDATASVIINPNNIKGWLRRCIASFELNIPQVHDAICAQFDHHQNEMFTKFMTSFRSNQKKFRPQEMKRNDDDLNAEDRQVRFKKEHSMTTDQVTGMNQLLQLLPGNIRSQFMDDHMPKFHQLFVKKRKYPRGCDVRKCNEMLRSAYEHGRTLKMHEFALFTEEGDESLHGPMNLVKRLGSGDEASVRWYFTAEIGDVDAHYFDLIIYVGYAKDKFMSFSNTPESRLIVYKDEVHIAIGFCDLALFPRCTIKSDKPHKNGPVRFVCIDQSVYAVAKSYVIYEMLKNEAISNESVLEVWYSATWTAPTKHDFQKTVQFILKTQKSLNDGDVLKYIKHWYHSQAVDIKTARKLWMDSMTDMSAMYIPSLAELTDMFDYIEYLVSGDVIIRNNPQPVCGNITMFNNVTQCPKKAQNESIYHVIDIDQAFGKIWKETKSFKQAAQLTLLNKVKRLKDMMMNHDIVIEFIHDMVSSDNLELIQRLKALKPYSVSWSNCIDYIHPMEFHKIAKQIGNKDCVHFAYTMNYQYSIKGCNIIDYFSVEARKQLFKLSKEAIRNIWEQAQIAELFRFPPTDHPINVGSVSCNYGMVKKWIHWFLSERNTNSYVGYNEDSVLPISYNPVQRTSMVAHFCWTYDPELTLNSPTITSI